MKVFVRIYFKRTFEKWIPKKTLSIMKNCTSFQKVFNCERKKIIDHTQKQNVIDKMSLK